MEAFLDGERIDLIIASLEVVLTTLKQANFLLDAKAWEMLRKVNDQVNAQGKTNPEVLTLFAPLSQSRRALVGAARRSPPRPEQAAPSGSRPWLERGD